jgi:hypothetical protein
MSDLHVRKGIISLSHDDIMLWTTSEIPGHIAMGFEGPGVITPLSGGLGAGSIDQMSDHELLGYLKHGMVFSGKFVLRDTPDGLKLTQGENITAISEPKPIDSTILRAMDDKAGDLARYREAHLSKGMTIELEDWQGVDRKDKTTADAIPLTVKFHEGEFFVSTPDGREVHFEFGDDVLRALAYEIPAGKISPMIVNLPETGDITINDHDYSTEKRVETETPGF